MALFLSKFINKIDKKGRVSVPAQFRGALNNDNLNHENFAGIIIYESFINDCIEGCDIARIAKISESIEDLKSDDYGYCASCGIEIGIRRLEARPTATRCIDCKTIEEIHERQQYG